MFLCGFCAVFCEPLKGFWGSNPSPTPFTHLIFNTLQLSSIFIRFLRFEPQAGHNKEGSRKASFFAYIAVYQRIIQRFVLDLHIVANKKVVQKVVQFLILQYLFYLIYM